jgi:DNA-binding HxlR family transcriptional regulator
MRTDAGRVGGDRMTRAGRPQRIAPCVRDTSSDPEALGWYVPDVPGDADVATVAALIGEPARAAVLAALVDGRALAATTLAAEADVAPSTLSAHLARLVDGGLIRVEPAGRHRYFRLAGP